MNVEFKIFVEKIFGSGHLGGDNVNLSVRCPACNKDNNKKKLVIRIDTGVYKCWVCGIKGSSIYPLLSRFSRSSLEEFTARFGKVRIDKPQDKIEEKVSLPDDFRLLGALTTSNHPNIKAAIRYLYKRGLNEKDLWKYKFGISSQTEFQSRIIFPSFDESGELNYFTARRFDQIQYGKYLNCKADRREIVFNEVNLDWTKPVRIVEGPFDLVKAGDNSTCILGSEFSKGYKLFQRLVFYNTPVVLALDSDMQEKQQRFARLLESYNLEVSLVKLSNQVHDPGSLSKEEFDKMCEKSTRWSWDDMIREKIGTIVSSSFKH